MAKHVLGIQKVPGSNLSISRSKVSSGRCWERPFVEWKTDLSIARLIKLWTASASSDKWINGLIQSKAVSYVHHIHEAAILRHMFRLFALTWNSSLRFLHGGLSLQLLPNNEDLKMSKSEQSASSCVQSMVSAMDPPPFSSIQMFLFS